MVRQIIYLQSQSESDKDCKCLLVFWIYCCCCCYENQIMSFIVLSTHEKNVHHVCRNISEFYFWILLVVFNAVYSHFDVLSDTGILFRLPWSWTVIELIAHRWTLQWKDCLNLISCALLFLWYMYFVLSEERGIFRVKFPYILILTD